VAKALDHVEPGAPPADVGDAAPRYWVEFGAYDGERYATVLKDQLHGLGIEADTATASGKGGKHYVRVRLARDTDRAAAQMIAQKAGAALHIEPLLHRVVAAAAIAATAPASPKIAGHWVQFGAFRPRRAADAVAARLVKNKIQATVLKTKNSTGTSLYLVRVEGLADRAAAEKIAASGGAVLHSKDVLVGEARAGPTPKGRAPPAR
jgi:cell division protein FtsN